MTTANVVFAGPVETVKPLMREAIIKDGQTLVGGHLVEIDANEWQAHSTADVGGDIHVIDMDTIGQKLVTDTLTTGQSHPAFTPEVGKSYNLILAAGQTITRGASLSSNGDGAVKATPAGGVSEALFTAEEAMTTTGATARIKARYNPTGVNATV